MTVIDLYHIESRPMYMDIATKKVFKDQQAANMRARQDMKKRGRFVQYQEGVKFPEGDTLAGRIAYGYTYNM